MASLGSNRSPGMRDVLGTIQADQDAIVRASSRGALVVDGGPGTGKTVVALHRTAYLLCSDPLLGHDRGGVLFVGPSRPYPDYVADVLPSLGEEGVQTRTLRDLVPEGVTAGFEDDPEVSCLKAGLDVGAVIEAAVRFYEEPPRKGMTVETDSAVACVIGDPTFRGTPRVRSLPPGAVQGAGIRPRRPRRPETLGTGIEGAVDGYVAMTRATQRLVVLMSPER